LASWSVHGGAVPIFERQRTRLFEEASRFGRSLDGVDEHWQFLWKGERTLREVHERCLASPVQTAEKLGLVPGNLLPDWEKN